MTWLATFGLGFLNAIIGLFGVGTLTALCVEWFRISNREGGASYFVIFLGLVGGVLGFVIGLVGSRIVASGAGPSFLKALSWVSGPSVGLLLVATLICWLVADFDTTLHGHPVQLQAEIRCPAGFVIPPDANDDHWYAHIDTRTRRVTSRSALMLDDARLEEGRWIIPVTLHLFTSVREKLLYIRLAENVQLFIPIFSAKPAKKFFSWSGWMEGGWETGKPRPEPAQRFNLRFRLQEVLPPEPPEQIEAQKQTAAVSALSTLTPESPLEESLKFTHYTHSNEQRQIAGEIIARRPDVLAEMTAQILSSDREISDRALRALTYIKPLPAELAAPVAAVGEKIIATIETFNTATTGTDSYYHGVDTLSALFTGWNEAHRALNDFAGVDGLPQLRRILELSLKREDSHVMKDVARVASHYVTTWSLQPVAP